MPSTLSIKNVPDSVLEQLRQRALRSHRSLQGELLAMLEHYVGHAPLTIGALSVQVQLLGLATQGDSTAMVREDRDGR